MTLPNANSDLEAPNLISVGAASLIDNAKRLGLTWTLTLATVTDGKNTIARCDGDTTELGMFSVIGPLTTGQRVYVLIVPPSGNFVIGTDQSSYAGSTLIDWIASITATGAIAVETVVLTGNMVTFRARRAYEVIFSGETIGSIASNTAGYIVRRTSLTGTLLYSISAHLMNVNVGFTQTCLGRAIIRNDTDSVINDNLVLTLQSIGGGTVTMTGSATGVRYMEIRDVGPASRYINAIQIT